MTVKESVETLSPEIQRGMDVTTTRLALGKRFAAARFTEKLLGTKVLLPKQPIEDFLTALQQDIFYDDPTAGRALDKVLQDKAAKEILVQTKYIEGSTEFTLEDVLAGLQNHVDTQVQAGLEVADLSLSTAFRATMIDMIEVHWP